MINPFIDSSISNLALENFYYLLGEMETAIDVRMVRWSLEEAMVARRRLENLSAEMQKIVAALRAADGRRPDEQ